MPGALLGVAGAGDSQVSLETGFLEAVWGGVTWGPVLVGACRHLVPKTPLRASGVDRGWTEPGA